MGWAGILETTPFLSFISCKFAILVIVIPKEMISVKT